MTNPMKAFDRSWLRRKVANVLAGSIVLLPASYAPLCLAQASAPAQSSAAPAHYPQANLADSTQSNPPGDASGQPTYQTPDDAMRELYLALQKDDEPALQKILGADNQLVSSGDATADKADRQRMVQKYQEMHRLVGQSDGSTVLFIGAENWPFPIPLVSRDGVWRFDPEAGAEEVRLREIGEDEVTAIQMCHALVETQGRSGVDQDPATREEAGSLLTTLLSAAPSGDKTVLFRGYYFRILAKSHDGFTAIAYPAAYGSTGFMTFVVNGRDVVYQKELGPTGARTAQRMSGVRLDSTWRVAD